MSTLSHENLNALIALNKCYSDYLYRAMDCFLEGMSPLEVVDLILHDSDWDPNGKFKDSFKRFDARKEIETCERESIRLLTWFDEDYPSLLKQTHRCPPLLYIKGPFNSTDKTLFAMVGSRRPSLYGLRQAEKIGRELANAGLTVVSGLARGIDQAAHNGALQVEDAQSIAVLGCGVDRIYPKENAKLYHMLSERGAIISEFALGTQPFARNFPRRNRIISGLSLGTLVVEAHLKSGSLITANEALAQGRDVFAIPGPVDQWTSFGTNRLLKEGAILTEGVNDILAELHLPLSMACKDMAAKSRSEKKRATQNFENPEVMTVLADGPRTYDQILEATSVGSGAIMQALLNLEISQKVKKQPDGRFCLL